MSYIIRTWDDMLYYKGYGDWTRHKDRAKRYDTAEEAQQVAEPYDGIVEDADTPDEGGEVKA